MNFGERKCIHKIVFCSGLTSDECDLPLFMCKTLAIFFIVESILDSVFSSSLPKSSSILKFERAKEREKH